VQNIVNKFSVIDSRGMTLLTPFVISKEKKIVYFHIAKTGGSTIHNMLRRNRLDDGVLFNKKGNYHEKLEYFKDVAENWDKYFKFTFIRNKYDLLFSLWVYDGKPGRTFENFVKSIVWPSKDQYGYCIDQHYLTVDSGKCLFDYIGRQENFRYDLDAVIKIIGPVRHNSSLRLNAARYNHRVHFSSHYNKDTSQIVYDKFKEEIDYFGFKLTK